jgi:hypothetical protein
VDNSRLSLDRARADLGTAKAALAAAHSGSLVTRLDEPDTGPYPVGPGRKVIIAAGGAAGLLLGLGLVFLGLGPQNDRRQGGDRRAVPRPATAPQVEAAAARRSNPAPASPEPVAPAAAVAKPVSPEPQREKPIFTAAPQWDDAWIAGPIVTPDAAERSQPRTPVEIPAANQPATAPVPFAPVASVGLPLSPVTGYAGMTLQEALAAARRLQP